MTEIGAEFSANIKKRMPKRATKGSAGYDFFMPKTFLIPPHETIEFKTGVAVDLPDGYFMALYPRSSVAKRGVTITNTVSIIDSDYKDEIHAFLTNNTDKLIVLEKDTKFMQGIIQKYYTCENENPVKHIRIGGLGSTGR